MKTQLGMPVCFSHTQSETLLHRSTQPVAHIHWVQGYTIQTAIYDADSNMVASHVSQSLRVGTTSQVNCTKIAKIQLGRPGAAS